MARSRRPVPDDGTETAVSEFILQSLRFGAVGLLNTATGLTAIYSVLFFFNSSPAIANAIGYAIGLGISFLLNRIWTFSNNQSIGEVLPSYLMAVAVSYLLNLSVVMLSVYYFDVDPYLAQFFGIGIYTITMFIGCKLFVFNKPISNKHPKKH
jgi:putative flippase GtrA